MMRMSAVGVVVVAAGLAWGGEPDVTAIMERVAANQTRAQAERSSYLYDQQVQVRLYRGGQKLAREEIRQYVVAPGPTGSAKQLVAFSGSYERDGERLYYSTPGYNYKEMDIDGEIADDFADEFADDKSTRDAFSAELFPLTAKEAAKYTFTLEGRENYRGREVYRVRFDPGPQAAWGGEALVDVAEFQPVLITSRLARNIPLWVQAVFGTNIKHLGFKVAYERFEEGVWFPATYGGEFDLKAVFVYKRKISLAVRNTGFRRAGAVSRIDYDTRALNDR